MAAQDRRAALLQVADRLLSSEGSDALRMDRLATAAGVTRPVVYEHFGSRDGLVAALLAEYGQLSTAQAQAAYHRCTGGLEARLVAAARAYLDAVEERGTGLTIVLHPLRFGPVVERTSQAIRQAGIQFWADEIRAHGDLSAPDALAASTVLIGALLSLSEQWLAGNMSRRRVEDLYRRLTHATLDALRRPA